MKFLDNLVFAIITASLVFVCFPTYGVQSNSDCIDWFKAGKIKINSKSCELDCANLLVDLNTFHCPSQCQFFCKGVKEKISIGKLIYYPGLTPAEKKIVEKYPEDALIVFIQKTRAEWSSSRNFPEQGLNDEGDAFRHFVWAGLLTKELGMERAKIFLDAHEANPLQSETERNMDQFNNEQGIVSALNLISNKKWSIENLEKSGLSSLKSKGLKVLIPGLKIPEVLR